MPCVAADGTLTPVAAQVLGAVAAVGSAGTIYAVASATGLPVYRVRSTLRELTTAHLIDDARGSHELTPDGRARLAAARPAVSARG